MKLIILLLRFYKIFISPLVHYLFPGGGCRYKVSCSKYAILSYQKYGIIIGSYKTLGRLLSCNNFFN